MCCMNVLDTVSVLLCCRRSFKGIGLVGVYTLCNRNGKNIVLDRINVLRSRLAPALCLKCHTQVLSTRIRFEKVLLAFWKIQFSQETSHLIVHFGDST